MSQVKKAELFLSIVLHDSSSSCDNVSELDLHTQTNILVYTLLHAKDNVHGLLHNGTKRGRLFREGRCSRLAWQAGLQGAVTVCAPVS